VPIVGPASLQQDPVDTLLILAWNIADEVIGEHRWFSDRGGRFLVPIPSPHYIG
jgi:hypothetical protein